MAYIIIPDTDVDAESPITQSLMLRLRDNPIFIANADDGSGSNKAPRILARSSGLSAMATPDGSVGSVLTVVNEANPGLDNDGTPQGGFLVRPVAPDSIAGRQCQTVAGVAATDSGSLVSNANGLFLASEMNRTNARHVFAPCTEVPDALDADISALPGWRHRSSHVVLGMYDNTESGGDVAQWGLNFYDIEDEGSNWLLKLATDNATTVNIGAVAAAISHSKGKSDTSWTTVAELHIGNEEARLECAVQGSDLAFRCEAIRGAPGDYAWARINVNMHTRGA